MLKFAHALCGVALALSAGAAQAQTHGDVTGVRPHVVQRPPHVQAQARYIVRATTLHCNDETGRDWPGSDEIYAIFTLRTPDRVGGDAFFARTNTFGDFDTGETKAFRADQNCLTSVVPGNAERPVRHWDCHPAGDRINLTFKVKLYEEDYGDDDVIGEQTVRWTQQELDALGLSVGQKSPGHIRIGGYTLNWEVQRIS